MCIRLDMKRCAVCAAFNPRIPTLERLVSAECRGICSRRARSLSAYIAAAEDAQVEVALD